MLLQALGENIIADMMYATRVIAPAIVVYLAITAGRRIKETGWGSAVTGYMIYMIGLAFFQFGSIIEMNYVLLNKPQGNVTFLSFYDYMNYMYVGGMIVFTFLLEYDIAKSPHFAYTWKKYRFFTILTIIVQSVLVPFTMFKTVEITGFFLWKNRLLRKGALYIFQSIVLVLVLAIYLFKFNTLHSVRRRGLPWIFYAGLAMGGASNFLQNNDYPITYFLNALVVLAGAYLLNYSWTRLPNLKELDWLLGLRELLVVSKKGSMTLVHHTFQRKGSGGMNEKASALAGSALGGFTQVLKQVLASSGDVNVIDHGDDKVYFAHAKLFTAVLITSLESSEYRHRLNSFAAAFGQEYDGVIDGWDGNIAPFQTAGTIITKTFKY